MRYPPGVPLLNDADRATYPAMAFTDAEKHKVSPRTLADDLLITAPGKQHVDDLVKANSAAHSFLEDMGAKVATHKSVLFASKIGSRKTLRNVIWECSGKKSKR